MENILDQGEQPAAPSPDDTAALDQLRAEAAADNQAQIAADKPAGKPPAMDVSADQMAGFAVDLAVQYAEARFPGIEAAVFDERNKSIICGALAPVLAKYDCKLPPWLEPYRAELTLFIVAAPILISARRFIIASAPAADPAVPAGAGA